MQLKETGAGEVTIWLAEMAVTIGGTDEEEAAQRKEREGTNNSRKRYPAISTVALSYLPIYVLYLASKRRSLQMDSGQEGRLTQLWPGVCAVHLTLTARVGPVYFHSVHLVVFSHTSLHFHSMTHTAQ